VFVVDLVFGATFDGLVDVVHGETEVFHRRLFVVETDLRTSEVAISGNGC
jgi:hypothetical protein